jgi:hypothetical protein
LFEGIIPRVVTTAKYFPSVEKYGPPPLRPNLAISMESLTVKRRARNSFAGLLLASGNWAFAPGEHRINVKARMIAGFDDKCIDFLLFETGRPPNSRIMRDRTQALMGSIRAKVNIGNPQQLETNTGPSKN